MKKIYSITFLLFPLITFCQSSIFDISFDDMQNNIVEMQKFKGKKILVATVDAASPNLKQLAALDTLSRRESAWVSVILIPVSDFGVSMPDVKLQTILKTELSNDFITVSKINRGKKNAGIEQHNLMKWLTDTAYNKHMNMDLQEPGQMFVIDEDGYLYAVLKDKISLTGQSMRRVLNKEYRQN